MSNVFLHNVYVSHATGLKGVYWFHLGEQSSRGQTHYKTQSFTYPLSCILNLLVRSCNDQESLYTMYSHSRIYKETGKAVVLLWLGKPSSRHSVYPTLRSLLCYKLRFTTNPHRFNLEMAAPKYTRIHQTKGSGTVEDPMVRAVPRTVPIICATYVLNFTNTPILRFLDILGHNASNRNRRKNGGLRKDGQGSSKTFGNHPHLDPVSPLRRHY